MIQLSVIVPFYNPTEKNLKRCINSILAHTHVPFEIILVDDGSKIQCGKIGKWYEKKYERIKYVKHRKNRGLYQARLSGLNCVEGKYIGFVDSDDYIANGYFDALLKYAEQENADVSVGQIVLFDENELYYKQDRCFTYPYGLSALGKTPYELFWKQEGRCYPVHVIWNKIYRFDLWTRFRSILTQQKGHLVMMEDFIFTAVLLSNTHKIAIAKNATYYYQQSSESSTGKITVDSIKKNVADMETAFSFIRQYLIQSGTIQIYDENLNNWEKRYARYWKRNIDHSGLPEDGKKHCYEKLASFFGKENIVDPNLDDDYFYELVSVVYENRMKGAF